MATDLLSSNPTTNLNTNNQNTGYSSLQASTLDPYGFNSFNQSAVGGSSSLQVLTPDANIVSNRMVFGTVAGEVRTPKTLTLSNTGSTPLTVTLNLGDSQEKSNAVRLVDHQRASDFQILDAPTGQPFTLGANETRNIQMQFAPQRTARVSTTPITHTFQGENYASLTINTNGQPAKTVNLAGLNTANYEANREPSLAEITRIFGWTTNIGTENIILGGQKSLLGDEVFSPYWVRADNTQPVQLWPIAIYSGPTDGPHDPIRFEAKPGSGGRSSFIYQHAGRLQADNVLGSNDLSGGENQKLLPKVLSGGVNTTPGIGNVSFTPNSPFALNRSLNSATTQGAWTDYTQNLPDQTHNWRIYPVRDAQGTLIPHTWLAASDPGNSLSGTGKNFDYNDDVYLMVNARPENSALDPSVGGRFPGSPDLQFYFGKTYENVFPNGLKDKNGNNIGFTSTQLNKHDTFTSIGSYNPNLLNLDTSGPGTLKITTTGGSNGSKDNTLINGLQTIFDGRASKSVISSKLLGPFNNIQAGYQQAGIMLGPDQDNYIKVVAIASNNNQLGIQFYQENNGVGQTIGTAAIPNRGSLQSLELKLFTNPQTGTVRAGYSVGNNNNVILLPGVVSLKGGQIGSYFAAQSKAGLIATNKGSIPFTATFDNFLISSNETTAQRQALHRINVGTSSSYTSPNGFVWNQDTNLFNPSNAVPESTLGTPDIKNTAIDPVYRSYRAKIGDGSVPLSSRLLSFALPVQAGNVDLRLHFSENYWGAPNRGPGGVGKRVFDVIVENQTVLHNFDITAASGGALTAVRVPIEGIQVNDGQLNIQLKAKSDFGAISAIEVFRSA
ncbi:malectin domain-containing carbohydrate-binding protein [Gloeocapsopsis dulcis]|nr:malectin domain-containing carbohydrate-binding protein [Gloeocapsopsis dulcis]WNN91617.1 malectin domain-containing carbohydrate-binding protein [Gloeocapsopsis dulcis]